MGNLSKTSKISKFTIENEKIYIVKIVNFKKYQILIIFLNLWIIQKLIQKLLEMSKNIKTKCVFFNSQKFDTIQVSFLKHLVLIFIK